MELSDRIVVLTGASRGIGRALARELAVSGCGLILTALEDSELSTLLEELQVFPVEVFARALDLTDFEERKRLIGWMKSLRQAPDILINNAGMGGYFGRFEKSAWSSIEKTAALNILALIHLTYELIPVLKSRPRAKIVNISSGIARLPYPGLAVYGATKGFVSSFSESLACEFAGTSVDVLCFHPGFTMTPFIGTSKMQLQKIPRWLIHSPEEVAAQIVEAIRKDKMWDYSDFPTRLLAWLGVLLPEPLKITMFKDLFWRLPDE